MKNISNKWQPKKLDVSDVNDGNQYNEGMITTEDYNKTIEGIMQANLDSELAVARADVAKASSEEAVIVSNLAKGTSEEAKGLSEQANAKSLEANASAISANETATQANDTAINAENVSSIALQIVQSITATCEENGGAIDIAVKTLADGNLQVVLKNSKGEKGEAGESGKVYQELGQNSDAPISQKVATNELIKKLEADEVLPLVSSKADKSYVNEELNKKANLEDIPSKVSALVNDSDYDTVTSVNQKIGSAGGAIISATEPKGKENAIWINPTSGIIKYWNGTAWASIYGVFA